MLLRSSLVPETSIRCCMFHCTTLTACMLMVCVGVVLLNLCVHAQNSLLNEDLERRLAAAAAKEAALQQQATRRAGAGR